MHDDYIFVNQTSARNLFWKVMWNRRKGVFQDLKTAPLTAAQRCREAQDRCKGRLTDEIVVQERAVARELRAWQKRWNLTVGKDPNKDWCYDFAYRQLTRWTAKVEWARSRGPVRVPVDILVGAHQDITVGPVRLIEFPGEEKLGCTELPEELWFFVSDGWRVHEAELWRSAKKRLKKNWDKSLEQYHERVEKMILQSDKWKKFPRRHFNWLVDRIVPETPGGKVLSRGDILDHDDGSATGGDEGEVTRETVKLARFIGIKIVGAKRGPGRRR
ncbi:MAG: hypothetical protein PHU25_09820 [Deltaproteobacteria bacterium]|nr:hypothetical protein [Deltaproteobacteria bacterium]